MSRKAPAILAVIALTLSVFSFTSPRASAEEDPARISLPSHIDPSGSTDVTAALTDFVERVPDGATIEFHPQGRYRVEGTFSIQGRRGLTLDGNGATIVVRTDGAEAAPPDVPGLGHRWPRHRAHVWVGDSSDIVIRDLAVRGPHDAGGTAEEAWVVEYEAQHAFEFSNTDGALLENCEASHIYGDGVYVGGGSTDVTVTGCSVHHNGRQGMTVTSGERITFVGNHLDEIRRTAFDLEPNVEGDLVRGVRIIDNVVGKVRLNFVSAHGAGGIFTDIEIARNRLEHTGLLISISAPENGERRSRIVIADNTSALSVGSKYAPINLTGVDGAVIRGNHQPLDAGRSGLAVVTRRSCEIDVHANNFPNAVPPVHRGAGWEGCESVPQPPPEPPAPTPGPPEPPAFTPGPPESPPAPPDQVPEQPVGDPGVCDAVPSVRSFSDVASSNVHRSNIACMVALEVTRGVTPTTFVPAASVTRGQMASFLSRLLDNAGFILPEGSDAFSDDDGTVHEDAINRLHAAGLIEGRSSRTFGPGDRVTRGQTATLVHRTHAVITNDRVDGPDAFSDDDGTVHEPGINAVAELGLMLGRTSDAFVPSEGLRRDQATSVLTRLVRST